MALVARTQLGVLQLQRRSIEERVQELVIFGARGFAPVDAEAEAAQTSLSHVARAVCRELVERAHQRTAEREPERQQAPATSQRIGALAFARARRARCEATGAAQNSPFTKTARVPTAS